MTAGARQRPWPVQRVMKELVERCELEPARTAMESGCAEIIRSDGLVRHTLVVCKLRPDGKLLRWDVVVRDEKYLEMAPGHAGIGLVIRWPVPVALDRQKLRHLSAPRSETVQEDHPTAWDPRVVRGDEYPWPVSGMRPSLRLMADVRRYGRPALDFVRDRLDLGFLLLEDEPVHRGEVFTQPPGSPSRAPARLVDALVLARDLGDGALEKAALQKLERQGDRDVGWSDIPYTFRQAAAFHAKQWVNRAGLDLQDVVRLARRGCRRKPAEG